MSGPSSSERTQRIEERLRAETREGPVQAWGVLSPNRRKQWYVVIRGLGPRTFSTAEVEAFLAGIDGERAGREAAGESSGER